MFSVNAALLDAVVLSVIDIEDTYGYKITQEVNNIINISESTLYPVLRRLQKNDDLEVYDMEYLGRNRRYYKITSKGKVQLELYKQEWKIYKTKIDKVFNNSTGLLGIKFANAPNNTKVANTLLGEGESL